MVNTRDTHAALNGTIVGEDEKFVTIDGNELSYPGDPSAPAREVINCRYVLVPDVDAGEGRGIEENDAQKKTGRSLESKAISDIMDTGAKGALTSENDPTNAKRDAHARRYYQSVRHSDRGAIVNAISGNTGIKYEVVDKMMKYLFYEQHDLEKGHTYFVADYDIAESVRRLRSNDGIQPHDLTFIRHESLESELMENGLNFDEAHEEAQRKYNYKQELLVFLTQNNLL